MRGRLHPNRRCLGRWPVLVPLLLLHVQACADAGTGDAADPRRPVSLGPPDAVFPEDFGYVHTVRELPGGTFWSPIRWARRSTAVSPIPLSPQDGLARPGRFGHARRHGLLRARPHYHCRESRVLPRQARHAGIGMGISSSFDGSTTTTFFRGSSGGSEEPDYDNYSWPSVKSALHPTTVRVDPLGRAWVQRHLPADTGTAYDLFDRQGQLVRAVTLEGDRRVAGFGRESVYMVGFDEFDLAYLERYGLP